MERCLLVLSFIVLGLWETRTDCWIFRDFPPHTLSGRKQSFFSTSGVKPVSKLEERTLSHDFVEETNTQCNGLVFPRKGMQGTEMYINSRGLKV